VSRNGSNHKRERHLRWLLRCATLPRMSLRHRSRPGDWPELRLEQWSDTAAALHLWTQVVGKIRLVQTPWTNHSWHVRRAFYSYAYPAPEGFADAVVGPEEAYWSADLSEFILPYEAVRSAASPDAVLLEFLRTTYGSAADLGGWDRDSLERNIG